MPVGLSMLNALPGQLDADGFWVWQQLVFCCSRQRP